MRDLTPEEREQIYLEEKARREHPSDAGSKAYVTGLPMEPHVNPAESEVAAHKAALQRLQKEEQETRARVQALLAFERQEKEAQQRRREKLKAEYEEKKEQEQERLDKWRRGNLRQLEFLASGGFSLGLFLLVVLGLWLKAMFVAVPIFCCLVLGRILKVPLKWMAIFSLLAVPALWLTYQIPLDLPGRMVKDEFSYYYGRFSQEQKVDNRVRLTAAQLYDLASWDVAFIDLERLDTAEQQMLLRHARAELDKIGEPERSSPKVRALYSKIDARWMVVSRGDDSHHSHSMKASRK